MMEVVTADGFQTNVFYLTAGDTYTLTLENRDSGALHDWVAEIDGGVICIGPTAGAGYVLGDLYNQQPWQLPLC